MLMTFIRRMLVNYAQILITPYGQLILSTYTINLHNQLILRGPSPVTITQSTMKSPTGSIPCNYNSALRTWNSKLAIRIQNQHSEEVRRLKT